MDCAPSMYQQLLMTETIYKNRNQLPEVLSKGGYKMHSEIVVPKVDAFLFLPIDFPSNRSEAAKFDFASLKHKHLAVGVCISGTWIHSGWDEKCVLGCMGKLKIDCNRSNADATASTILQSLNDFLDDFPEISQYGIKLNVYISGYSLGGMYAQVTTIALQDWAHTTRNTISCRTFDNPGVPETYHTISRNFDGGDPAFWKARITNYKSYPSPLNTVFKDLGKIYHLKNMEEVSNWDPHWIARCISGSTRRLAAWGTMASKLGQFIKKEEDDDEKKEGESKETVSSEQALLRVLATTAALDMGMDVVEVVYNHDLARMRGCFDESTEQMLPAVCVEMQEWPIYDGLMKTGMKLLQNVGSDLVLVNPSNAGIHTLLGFGGKKGYIERKLSKIEGYVPMGNQ